MESRLLSGAERAVWKNGAISLNIVMAARIGGDVQIDALRSAWRFLQSKHPLLRSHLQTGPPIAFSTDGTLEIPVRKITTEGQLHNEMIRELERPFLANSKEPLLRSLLIATPGGVNIVITCHHCISDGLSIMSLIRDLLSCLGGCPELVTSTGEDVLDDLLPPEAAVPLPVSLGISLLNFLFSPLRPPGPTAGIPMEKSQMLAWALNREQTSAFAATCRKHNVGVQAAIIALFQAAQYHVQGNNEEFRRRNYTPVNVRKSLTKDVGNSFGLFASEAYLSCSYDTESSFWENARQFQTNLLEAATDKRTLRPITLANKIRPAVLDRILLFLLRRQTLQFGYVVSNLGKWAFPDRYGPLSLEGIAGPVIYVKRAEKTLTLLTFGGEMHLTLTYRPDVISTETICRIRDESMNIIDEIVL